jgi:hypothetical protein
LNKLGTRWLAILVLVVAGVVTAGGLLTARGRAERDAVSVAEPEASMIIESASEFWDNPLQRLTHVAVAIVERDHTRPCAASANGRSRTPAETTTVRAYTLFGIAVDTAIVECDGSTHRAEEAGE